jgi:hypothetical protein
MPTLAEVSVPAAFRFVIPLATAVTLVAGSVVPLVAQEPTVTKVVAVVNPKSFSGDCPAELKFTGTIFVSRHPVSVTYEWERSDGARSGRKTIEIRSAGQGVSETWKLGARGETKTVWEKLHVLAPTGISSNEATVQVRCSK